MPDRDETERARRDVFDEEAAHRTEPGSDVDLDDLSPLEVQVRALRQDLAAYRWAIERILRRRMWALGAVVAIVGVSLAVVGVGAAALLSHEADRAERVLESARLDSCARARTVQAQVATILATLESRVQAQDDDPPPWLEQAIREISTDPCGPRPDEITTPPARITPAPAPDGTSPGR